MSGSIIPAVVEPIRRKFRVVGEFRCNDGMVGLSPEAAALPIETEELMAELHVRAPGLMAKNDKSRYLEAVPYASVARELLTYHAALARPSDERLVKLLDLRDAMMAENLTYAVSLEHGRGKVLAFAHNSMLHRCKVA